MATEFNDSQHFGLFLTDPKLTSASGKYLRHSELTLAALRSTGALDRMIDGETPPATDKLWLDKNSDPAVLKEWDSIGAYWAPMSFERLFERAAATPLSVTGGDGSNIVVSEPSVFISNRLYSVSPNVDNVGATTITVTGVGTFDAKYIDGNDVVANEFAAGRPSMLIFRNGRFELLIGYAAQIASQDAQAAAEAAAASIVDKRYSSLAQAEAASVSSLAKTVGTSFRSPLYAVPDTLSGGANYRRVSLADIPGAAPASAYFRSTDRFMPDGTTDNTNGGYWIIDEEALMPQMFGGVANSYADRSINTVALNDCFKAAGIVGASVDLGYGDWFFDDTLIISSGVEIKGRGVNYWHAKYGDGTNPATKVACATQLVACGTFSKDYNYVACSSMKVCGADRVNPSTRAGYNDGIYRMYSFTDGPGTLKDFSIGLLIQADGVKLSSFRIVPYGGGTRGIDGYNNASLVGWNSNIDFGIWNDYRKNITMEDIQAVGHWRGAGYQFSLYRMGAEASDDLQSQSNIHYRCIFQGFRGHMVRGADVFQVTTVNTGSNWAEVPYADDHPFHADTFGLVKKANNHTGSTNLPAITGVSVVTPGFLRLQFAGSITGLLSAGNEIVVNGNSGANSHNVYHDCAFFGITHPSGKMAHDQDLTDAFPMPSTMLEMSGWRGVEYTFYSPRFHGIEEVMWHFHSIQKVQFFDGQFETSTNADGDNGARLIVSPSAGSNPHATYPAGQTFLINLNAPNASTEDRIDWRPYAPVAGLRFNDGADNGFLAGNRFHWNDYEGASGTIGPFLRPPVDGTAGIKKSGFPSAANRFVYDDAQDKLIQSVGIDTSAFEANFGLVTGSATSIVYKSGRKVDFTLADDAVANIALQTNGAILALGTNTPGTASNGGFASIRTGTTSQNCAIIVGANMTAEGSTVLSDGTGNGTDAKYNVSCQNGVLQIKNRKGNSETFHLELLAST